MFHAMPLDVSRTQFRKAASPQKSPPSYPPILHPAPILLSAPIETPQPLSLRLSPFVFFNPNSILNIFSFLFLDPVGAINYKDAYSLYSIDVERGYLDHVYFNGKNLSCLKLPTDSGNFNRLVQNINLEPLHSKKLLEAFILANLRQAGLLAIFTALVGPALANNSLNSDDECLKIDFNSQENDPNVLACEITKTEFLNPNNERAIFAIPGKYYFNFKFNLRMTPSGTLFPTEIYLTLWTDNREKMMRIFDGIFQQLKATYSYQEGEEKVILNQRKLS